MAKPQDVVLPEELSSWVQESREAAHHSALLCQSVHVRIAQRVQHPALNAEESRQLLVVLRNLCAGGASVSEAICETGVLASAHRILSGLTTRAAQWNGARVDDDSDESLELRVLRAGTQLLANMSTASAVSADAVWQEFFPHGFLELSQVKLWPVVGPLSTCLVSCARWSKQHSRDLCSPTAAPLLSSLLEFGTQVEGPENERFGENEWLLMLIGRLVYCDGLLEEVYTNLHGGRDSTGPMSKAQLELLRFLAIPDVLDWVPESNTGEGMFSAFLAVFKIAQDLTNRIREIGAGAVAEGLELCCLILKNLSCLDKNVKRSNGNDVVSEVCDQGFVAWLLDCLKVLGSIQNPRTASMDGSSCSSVDNREVVGKMEELDLNDHAIRMAPYIGFRTDIVAILSNIVFRRRKVQNLVLKLGGVHLLLNQCQFDDGSPLVREWAVWAIRNLCEDNTEIQTLIRNLELQGVVKNEELDKLGIKIEIDKSTGKLRVGKKEYGEYTFI